MNQTDANRTSYDALREATILMAIQDPARRAELIRFLESRGLLLDPSGRRV